jgi:hypothetical protein
MDDSYSQQQQQQQVPPSPRSQQQSPNSFNSNAPLSPFSSSSVTNPPTASLSPSSSPNSAVASPWMTSRAMLFRGSVSVAGSFVGS